MLTKLSGFETSEKMNSLYEVHFKPSLDFSACSRPCDIVSTVFSPLDLEVLTQNGTSEKGTAHAISAMLRFFPSI
jgi:hypothetical protein